MSGYLVKTFRKEACCLVLVLVATIPLLLSAHTAAAGAISQNFQTNTQSISAGTLLSLVATGQDVVEPANSNNAANLVGIASSKPLVELSNTGSESLPVILSGTAQALVSNINGSVKVGDKITPSPIDGIGMKATSSAEVIGTAEANLDSVQTVTQSVTQNNGKATNIKVGLVSIGVTVAYYSAPQNNPESKLSSLLPPFLQTLANNISGKQVSPLRVLVGALTLILGFTTTMIMLYASIRATTTSIGRNPLAESALRKGFINVFIATMGVLILTIGATYVALTS